MKEWIFLIIAIVSETFATVMLKYSEQFTRLWPSLGTAIGYLLSFYFLALALRTIPVGLAYALWGAIGIVLILIISAVLFKQTPDLPAIIGILFIIAGIVIINYFSKMKVGDPCESGQREAMGRHRRAVRIVLHRSGVPPEEPHQQRQGGSNRCVDHHRRHDALWLPWVAGGFSILSSILSSWQPVWQPPSSRLTS